MRRRAAGRLAALLAAVVGAGVALATPAVAQDTPAPPATPSGEAAAGPGEAAPAIPDVPSGPAVLRGRVVHEERPEAAGEASVVLYALGPDGQPGTREGEVDAEGRFAFEGLSNDPGVVYLVGARYAGLPFPGDRVVFGPGETERTIEVPLFEPSDDLADVRVVQSSLRVALGSGRISVAEVHRLRNDGERVFHVPPGRRAGRRAPLEARLIEGVEHFAMPLGVVPEGATREGRDFAFWGPIYPGEQEISYRYEVPVEPGDRTLTKRFPTAAERIRVFASEGGPLRGVSGMAPGEPVEESGLRFVPYEVASPEPGFTTRLDLRIPEMLADPGAVQLAEAQIVLEVDDVRLQAQEQLRIEVTGDAMVRAEPGELLLELPLPEGAEDVRFSADAGGLGLVRTETGVGLVGPIAPGSHGIGLAWGLRSGPDGVRVARHYDRRLPLLRVFVADTGVAVSSERLHRRRPVRDADRTYLIFEAFELQGGERLGLSLQALPPRGGSGGPALAAAAILGVGALVFLLAPLGRGDAAEAASVEDAPVAADRDERELLYESIRDLDHDHETGKLDDETWQALRAELRGRAVALLAEERRRESERERAAAAPVAAGETSVAPCRACGARPRPGDRFCASCGGALAEPAA